MFDSTVHSLASTPDPSEVDDAELVELIQAWERLASWAAAGQLAAIAELARRRPRDLLDRPGGQVDAGHRGLPEVSEFAVDEVAAALRLSRPAAGLRLTTAVELTRLPATAGALRDGVLDVPKVRAVVDAVSVLDDATAAAVERQVLPRAALQTVGRLRNSLARAVLAADPAAAEQRHEQAVAGREVTVRPLRDGMAELWAFQPADAAAAVYARIDRIARAAPATDPRTMDARRADALVTTVLTAAPHSPARSAAGPTTSGTTRAIWNTATGITGTGPTGTTGTPATGTTATATATAGTAAITTAVGTAATAVGTGTSPGAGIRAGVDIGAGAEASAAGAAGVTSAADIGVAAHTGAVPPRSDAVGAGTDTLRPGSGASGVARGASMSADSAVIAAGHWETSLRAVIHVTVPGSTALGLDDAPGDLAGHGPIPASMARRLATGRGGRKVTLDPVSGAVTDIGRTAYTPSAALADLVRARDHTCRFPGCRQPAGRCDLDHVVPWPEGSTTAGNLAALCRHHHRLKHQTQWTVRAGPRGELVWTTPTGHTYRTDPATD